METTSIDKEKGSLYPFPRHRTLMGIFIIVLRRYLLQRDAPGKSIFLMSCVLVILALPCRYLGEQNAETAMLILAAPMAWCYLLFFCR